VNEAAAIRRPSSTRPLLAQRHRAARLQQRRAELVTKVGQRKPRDVGLARPGEGQQPLERSVEAVQYQRRRVGPDPAAAAMHSDRARASSKAGDQRQELVQRSASSPRSFRPPRPDWCSGQRRRESGSGHQLGSCGNIHPLHRPTMMPTLRRSPHSFVRPFMAPVLIGHMPMFWDLLRAAGCSSTRAERLDDRSYVN